MERAQRGLPMQTGVRTKIMKVVKTAPNNQVRAGCSALTEAFPGLFNKALASLLQPVVS